MPAPFASLWHRRFTAYLGFSVMQKLVSGKLDWLLPESMTQV